MKGLVEGCEEFSPLAEKSLMWRSKPGQLRTWSQRWKRVSYIRHLSTRTLKPSHSKNFVTEYLSYQQDFPVNLSHPLVVELPQRILDTFIPTSQEESRSADQLMLFSKMSKELSQAKQPMGSRYSNMSSEIWKKEVIRLRGEYSQRVKLGHHTNGRESSYWPTAYTVNIGDGTPWEISKKQMDERRARTKKAVKEGKVKAGSGRSMNLAMAVQKNWSTPIAGDWKGQVRGNGKPASMLCGQVENNKNWRTPTQMDGQDKDRFDYALRLLGGKITRHSGERVQVTLGDHVTMEELKDHPDLQTLINNVSMMKQRTKLPKQKEFVDYIRSQTTIKELNNNTTIKKSTIEHWFRYDTSGFSFPSIEDWEQIKPHLKEIEFDDQLTYEESIEWKPKSWPTPKVMEPGWKLKDCETKDGEEPKVGERAYNKKTGIHKTWGLNQAVEIEKEKSWPTPQTSDRNGAADPTRENHRTQLRDVETNHLPNGLQDQGKNSTPGKSQESWGTPRQSMANAPTIKNMESGNPWKRIEDQVVTEDTFKMKLNPNWVEQLMGLPVGWTQLPIEWTDYDYWGME